MTLSFISVIMDKNKMIIYLITHVNDNFYKKIAYIVLYLTCSSAEWNSISLLLKKVLKKHLTYENRQIKSGACNQWGYKWNEGVFIMSKGRRLQ